MASWTKTCRNWLTKEDVFKFRDIEIPEELKKRRKPIVAFDDIETKLKRGEREVLQGVQWRMVSCGPRNFEAESRQNRQVLETRLQACGGKKLQQGLEVRWLACSSRTI